MFSLAESPPQNGSFAFLTEQRWHGVADMPVTCLHRQWVLTVMNDACEACFVSLRTCFLRKAPRSALVMSPLPVNQTPFQSSGWCWARPVLAGSLVMLLTDSRCPFCSIVHYIQREPSTTMEAVFEKSVSSAKMWNNWSDFCATLQTQLRYVLCI